MATGVPKPAAPSMKAPKLKAMMDYDGLRAEQASLREQGIHRGIGLAAFIDRQADAWHAVTGAVPWLPFLATAAGLRSIHQNHTLHFVLVSARKPRS